MTTRSLTFLSACAVVIGLQGSAAAEPVKTDRAAAARLFDDAVSRFEQADYAGAAKAFLEADDLAPSTAALHNAIAAARKANDHLLVATAAERAISRPNERQELVTEAREALVMAAKNLAQVDLECSPAPCKLLVDGAPVPAGKRYMLPGACTAVAVADDGNRTEEHLTLAAGTAYSVLLHAAKSGQAPEAAAVSTRAAEPELAVEPRPKGTDTAARRPEPVRHDGGASVSKRPLSPTVFYVGATATAVLIGVNVWSGIDTLSAKNDLPNPPRTVDLEAVRSKETRSNVLFAGTIVVGTATILAGILWVDWGHGNVSAGLLPNSDGASVFARGRF